MHHYPYHISDFNNATRHLNRLERSIYRDLIDLYYHTEKPLSDDIALICRLIIANSIDERTAVEQVLKEFFTFQNGVYYHAYCEQVIQKYHAQTDNQSKAGKASAKARALKAAQDKAYEQVFNECSTDVQQVFNQPEPITINHKPERIKEVAKATRSQFIKPSLIEIETYFLEKGHSKDNAKKESDKFFNYYESKGWLVGKVKMKNWKASVSGWITRNKEYSNQQQKEESSIPNAIQKAIDAQKGKMK